MPPSADRPSRIQAFGPEAVRVAKRYDGVDVLLTDRIGSALALQAAVARRLSGQPFYVAALIDEPRAVVAQMLSGAIVCQHANSDERRDLGDALAQDRTLANSQPQSTTVIVNEEQRRVLRDVVASGYALWLRSSCEGERISRMLQRTRPYSIVAPGFDPAVPTLQREARERIVVWAPHLAAERLGVIAVALDNFRLPVTYICESGKLLNVKGDFVSVNEASAYLARAVCVVDASVSDPAAAISLARAGLTVVAATTAGAAEFVDGIHEYAPWDWRQVHAAVSVAIGSSASIVKRDPFPRLEISATINRSVVVPIVSPPLVSIVLATYNRRQGLAGALESIARQTYTNIEVIVVNDGGCDITDVVAHHPFVRLLDLGQNIGAVGAFVSGLREVRGDYFCMFCDDDLFTPDHITRLMGAIRESGCRIANGNTMARYFSEGQGETRDVAFKLVNYRCLDQLEVYVGAMLSCGSMLMHRSLLPIAMHVDPITEWSDQEQHICMSQTDDFAHVDDSTYVWAFSFDRTSHSSAAGKEHSLAVLRALYERYPKQSAIVARRRQLNIDNIEARYPSTAYPDVWLPKE